MTISFTFHHSLVGMNKPISFSMQRNLAFSGLSS